MTTSYKRGTVANLTIRYPDKPRLQQTWRAIMTKSGDWRLEDGSTLGSNSFRIENVQPLHVIDAKNLDLKEMLSDLVGVRDGLKYLSGLVTTIFPGSQTRTRDLWSIVCDLVDAFGDLIDEKPFEPPVEEPGVGGIVDIMDFRYSRGVDYVWRDRYGHAFTWHDLTKNGETVTVISPGI